MLHHPIEIVRASAQDIETILSLNQLLKVDAPEFKGNTYDFVEQEVAAGNYFVVKDRGNVVAAACISPRDEGMYLETALGVKNIRTVLAVRIHKKLIESMVLRDLFCMLNQL